MGMREQARRYCMGKHHGELRKNGKPYAIHPIRVARLVKKYLPKSKKLDKIMAAAYLHDILEDTCKGYDELFDTLKEIIREFGEDVAILVLELTNDKKKIESMGKDEYLADKIRRISKEAVVIKLSDRLDNLNDLKDLSDDFKIKVIEETESILSIIEEYGILNEDHYRIIIDIRIAIDEVRNTINSDVIKLSLLEEKNKS